MSKFIRRIMTDSEEMRIKLYLIWGGFHYKTVARYVYGKGRRDYVPTTAEISRVGKVARDSDLSSRDWRNGLTSESRKVLKHPEYVSVSAKSRKSKKGGNLRLIA